MDRDHCRRLSLVGEFEGEVTLLIGEMFEQLVAVRCVAHHQIFVFINAIDQHIVAASTVGVADERIANHPRLHAINLARADAIKKLACVTATETQSSHVRNIEETSARAALFVLLDDRAVHDGHLVARVLHHARFVLKVQ